jgi:hypothetical protein
MWGRDWVQVNGRVIAARPKPGWEKRHTYASSAVHQYVVEYRLDDGEQQEAEFELGVPMTDADWMFPGKGSKVPLLVHPGSGKVKLDTKAVKRNREAARRADQSAGDAEFEAARRKR